jgi:hypothetical protein
LPGAVRKHAIIEAEKERHPKANPVAQELSKEIARLEAKKTKRYNSTLEVKRNEK